MGVAPCNQWEGSTSLSAALPPLATPALDPIVFERMKRRGGVIGPVAAVGSPADASGTDNAQLLARAAGVDIMGVSAGVPASRRLRAMCK